MGDEKKAQWKLQALFKEDSLKILNKQDKSGQKFIAGILHLQASEHINLKVLGQDNAIIQFKIKKHTPLKKLMNAYCERASLSMSTVRFRFDGQAINEMDTPDTLEMEEGDTIEVYQQQTGGYFEKIVMYNNDCINKQCSHHFKYFPSNKYNFNIWTMRAVL